MSCDDVFAFPPLQAFSRLSTRAFNTAAADKFPTPEVMQLLRNYLQLQSCNLAEVEVLRQWEKQHGDRSDKSSTRNSNNTNNSSSSGSSSSHHICGLDLASIERAVATRAAAVRAMLEQSREKATIMASAAAAAAAAATNAASAATGARAVSMQENSRVHTTTVTQWWHLSCAVQDGDEGFVDSPWAFALSAGDDAAERPVARAESYCFLCLRDALELIEPYLTAMRCAAALGAEDVLTTVCIEGQSFVTTQLGRGEAAAIFALLELERTYVTLTFGGRAGVAGVARAMQNLRVVGELKRLASLLERMETRENEGHDTPQPSLPTPSTMGPAADAATLLMTKAQAYWRLAASYATFFHTVAAYLDGVAGHFERFAVAVIGAGSQQLQQPGPQPELSLWGAARFPFLTFAVADAAAAGGGGGGGPASTGTGAGGSRPADTLRGSSKAPATVQTRLAALFPTSTAHVTSSVADFYLADYKPLITAVIAPARTFCALLVLSAVATLPLPHVTQQLPRWVELRELYENCEELEGLLSALQGGRLGTAWNWAQAAAGRYLAQTPHLHPAVLQRLLQSVQQALCYHYVRARGVVSMARAAEDLCFTSIEEFMRVATSLIRDQLMDARMDLVSGTIELRKTDTNAEEVKNVKEAAARATLSLSTLEMHITCMSAERNLIFVPPGIAE